MPAMEPIREGILESALIDLAFDIVIAPSAEGALEAEDVYYTVKQLTAENPPVVSDEWTH